MHLAVAFQTFVTGHSNEYAEFERRTIIGYRHCNSFFSPTYSTVDCKMCFCKQSGVESGVTDCALLCILYFGTEDGCNFTVNYDKIKYFNTLAVNPLKV